MFLNLIEHEKNTFYTRFKNIMSMSTLLRYLDIYIFFFFSFFYTQNYSLFLDILDISSK